MIGVDGGVISLPELGIALNVPKGALDKPAMIEITTTGPLEPSPPDDEIQIGPGIKCSPSGIQFKRPVKLTVQHCLDLVKGTRLEDVEVILYTRQRYTQSRPTKR